MFLGASLLTGCVSVPTDDPTTTLMLSGAGETETEGESTEGSDTLGSTGIDSATSIATSGMDSTGNECDDENRPMVTSSTETIMLMPGQTMVSFDLDFDREVTIEAGGLIVTGDAFLTSPELTDTAATFPVVIEGIDPSQAYVFTVDGGAVFDGCSRTLPSSIDILLQGDCSGNAAPQSTTIEFHQLPGGMGSDSYEISFDEIVTLEAGAISVVSGSAVIDSITPALPAASDTFTVELSNLGEIDRLQVDASLVSDGCGAGLEQSFDVWVCTVTQAQFGFAAAPEPFIVPGCAQGMLALDLQGAQGESALGGGTGGLGGQALGDLAVMSGDTLEINVGGQAGYGGGGVPGTGAPNPSGNGGGASDIRLGGSALADRVIVAGGGAGAGAGPQGSCSGGVGGNGGSGGGESGNVGTEGTGCGAIAGPGTGGSQVAGGTGGVSGANCTIMPAPGSAGMLGIGGDGSDATDCNGGGFTGGGGAGGGGGYYGGGGGGGGPGGGGGSWGGGGGGGGSSYTGGVLNGSTSAGVSAGDGSVTLSW